MNRTSLIATCTGVLLCGIVAVGQSQFPPPTGHVNDFARVLDSSSRAELEELLSSTEQKTSAEVVVATVPSLNGMSVEEYANRLFQQWGIGKKREDNGILVLVAPSERQMRIEVGYGLEPILPDGLAGEIIRSEFLPRFRDGDFAGGIQNGMRRIVTLVEAHHVLTPAERARLEDSADDNAPAWVLLPFLGIFVGLGAFAIGLGARTKTVAPLIFGGLFGGLPMVMAMGVFFKTSLLTLGPFAVGMAIWGFRLGARREWQSKVRGPSASGSGWSMGGNASSGGSSSSGGGSFGGGSSGGGGASGRW